MPIRLLVLNHTTARSGGEIVLLRFLRLIDKKRFELVALFPNDGGMLCEESAKIPQVRLRFISVNTVWMNTRRLNAIRAFLLQPNLLLAFFNTIRETMRVIRDERIDIVFTNSIKSDYYGSLAAYLMRRPVVWYMHDIVDHHYFPGWTQSSLVLFANLFASKIICNSNATRLALKNAGVSAKKLVTVYPPPIDLLDSGERVDIRRELGLPLTTTLVTMVGRITAPKGQMEFVQAAQLIMSARDNVVFLIVGDNVFGAYDDDYKRQVEKTIAQLPDPGRVRMLGARQDVIKIMPESDVIVFHSLWPEGFGLAVAEALILGRPIVSTLVGGTAEIIEDGVTGIGVKPGDIIGLSAAITNLLDNPALAGALGHAGQQYIRQLLSLKNVRQLEITIEKSIYA